MRAVETRLIPSHKLLNWRVCFIDYELEAFWVRRCVLVKPVRPVFFECAVNLNVVMTLHTNPLIERCEVWLFSFHLASQSFVDLSLS